MEALSAAFGKISNYNILNNLIPGAILCVIFKYLVGYDLMNVGIVELFILFYFVGMINSRIGSLIVQWILEKIQWVSFRDHHSYMKAEQNDKKIESLVEVNNMYRSMISVAFIALLAKLYFVVYNVIANAKWAFGCFTEWLCLLLILVLFAFAYKKQTKLIVSRIDFYTKTA